MRNLIFALNSGITNNNKNNGNLQATWISFKDHSAHTHTHWNIHTHMKTKCKFVHLTISLSMKCLWCQRWGFSSTYFSYDFSLLIYDVCLHLDLTFRCICPLWAISFESPCMLPILALHFRPKIIFHDTLVLSNARYVSVCVYLSVKLSFHIKLNGKLLFFPLCVSVRLHFSRLSYTSIR